MHMADGMSHETVLKVGFLNEKIDELLPKFKEIYDVVITLEGDFSFVNEQIIKPILTNSNTSK